MINFYTVSEAAELLHVTPRTIRNLIASNILQAYKLTGRRNETWRINPESLDSLLRKNETLTQTLNPTPQPN